MVTNSYILFFCFVFPTPIFLPGEFHGQWGLGGHNPWGLREWGTSWASSTSRLQIPYSAFNETLCWASAPSMGENSCIDSTLNIAKIIIYTKQWSSCRGDFAPQGTFLARTGDIFCCHNWGFNWHVAVGGQGYCWTFCNSQDTTITKLFPPFPLSARWRNSACKQENLWNLCLQMGSPGEKKNSFWFKSFHIPHHCFKFSISPLCYYPWMFKLSHTKVRKFLTLSNTEVLMI